VVLGGRVVFSGRWIFGPLCEATDGSIFFSTIAAIASASAILVGFFRPATVIPTTIAPRRNRNRCATAGPSLEVPSIERPVDSSPSLACFDSTQAGEAVVSACRDDVNCSAACWELAVFATRLLISIGPSAKFFGV